MALLTIRKARQSDLGALLSLWKELAGHNDNLARSDTRLRPHLRRQPDAARKFADWVRKHFGSRNHAVYFAQVNGKPAGYCMIYIRPNPLNPKASKLGGIDHLVVKKEFRGRRISSALYREALAWFRQKGIRRLSLTVLERNRIPQSIYRKWGFFPFVVEMRKNL